MFSCEIACVYVLLVVLAVVKFLIVLCVCGSFVRRRLSMTFELVGICVRFFFSLGALYLFLGNFTKLFVQIYFCVTQGRS